MTRRGSPLIDDERPLAGSITLDLRELQASVSKLFDDWSRSSRDGASPEEKMKAVEYRSEIHAVVRRRLSTISQDDLNQRGIYLFFVRSASSLAETLVYVGLIKSQVVKMRLSDYIIKDWSILDPGLLEMELEPARAEVLRRLSAAMPKTSEKKRTEYLRNHSKARSMSRADMYAFCPIVADKELIEEVEWILIPTANSFSSSLQNGKKLNWPDRRVASLSARDHARIVVKAWMHCGLDHEVGNAWLCAIERIPVGG
jgi:hypothetical protein